MGRIRKAPGILPGLFFGGHPPVLTLEAGTLRHGLPDHHHHHDHHHDMSTFAEVLLIILLVALLFIELVVWIAASKDTSFMSTILTTIETGIH